MVENITFGDLHELKTNCSGSIAVFGLSISKVFVNFREGEIRAKIGHFRYSSDIRVVLPDL